MDCRNGEDGEGKNSFHADVADVIAEGIPYWTHPFRSVRGKEKDTGEEGEEETPEAGCNIAQVKTVFCVAEEAGDTERGKSEEIVHDKLHGTVEFRL